MRGVEQIPWVYDALMGVLDRTGLARWRAWLARGAKGRTLDLGCGTGRNLPYYGRISGVIGLDPSREALARARRRSPGARLVRAKAEALPFRDGTFETVVSGLVLCSVTSPPAALAEVRRVLARDGEVRLIEHVRAEGWRGRLQDWIQPAWTLVAGGCHPNRRTESAVETGGFELVEEGRRADGTMRRFAARVR